ncbi:MAG TPA: hypothetical protein VJP77_07945 [Planctomycetota bacterium]|nr:hypothetical protein [Planctomycetota bacterium]
MAAQIETQNQLGEVLAVLRRRRLQILLPAAYVLVLGVAIASFLPRKYLAEMQVNLLETQIDEGTYGASAPQASPQREIENAEAQIKQALRIRSIIEEEGWTDFLALPDGERWEYIQSVQDNIDIFVLPKAKERGSTFVDIGYSDTDPQRALKFLEELARRWVVDVFERDLDILRDKLEVLQTRRDDLRKELELLEDQENALLREGNLSITNVPSNTTRDEDPVFTRKVENERERDAVTLDLAAVRTEITTLEEEHRAEPETIAGDPTAGPLGYAGLIAQAEAQIEALRAQRTGLLPAHSQYSSLTRAIDELQRQIEELRLKEAQQPASVGSKPNPRRDFLEELISAKLVEAAALEKRRELLEGMIVADETLYGERVIAYSQLTEVRREIGFLEQKLESAELEYDEAKRSLGLLEDVYGQPYEITKSPVVPDTPTSPNVPMIIGFALILGLGLGLGLAFLAEFSQPGFRSVFDVSRTLAVPVLGVVDEIVTRRTRRRHALRRSMVVLSSAVLLGSLGWFTWAWTNRPELLSTELLEAIEDFRSKLR